jgi:hypothetical protein
MSAFWEMTALPPYRSSGGGLVQGEKEQVHCMSAIHRKGKYTVDLKKMLIFWVRKVGWVRVTALVYV